MNKSTLIVEYNDVDIFTASKFSIVKSHDSFYELGEGNRNSRFTLEMQSVIHPNVCSDFQSLIRESLNLINHGASYKDIPRFDLKIKFISWEKNLPHTSFLKADVIYWLEKCWVTSLSIHGSYDSPELSELCIQCGCSSHRRTEDVEVMKKFYLSLLKIDEMRKELNQLSSNISKIFNRSVGSDN